MTTLTNGHETITLENDGHAAGFIASGWSIVKDAPPHAEKTTAAKKSTKKE